MDQYKELLNELESCLKISKKDLAEIDEERKENAVNNPAIVEILNKAYQESPDKLVLARTISN